MTAFRFVTFVAVWGCLEAVQSVGAVDFASEVRPLLERSCFKCHGPEKQESGLRLDVRQSALTGGEPAIIPDESAESMVIRYVTGDGDIVMPPEDSGLARLTADEIAVLRQWVDAGAAWPDALAGTAIGKRDWWSLKPLVRPTAPSVISDLKSLISNPIDAFIQSKLAEKKLAPSPEASPRALVRRLYYDLTGLPPTLEAVEAFESACAGGQRESAYSAMVAQLLDSPRYGEHWARHWLDVVHYADTHGNDHDHARPNSWPYRDYVIESFNADKPYARFVQEQVAGDALFPDDSQATVGLGFLAAGPWDDTLMVVVRDDTTDHLMGQVLDRDDMVSTVMSTFQSLTVHCARCHNHKFDPISQREYYALQAVFAGVDRADRPVDVDAATQFRRHELLAKKQTIERRDPELLAALESANVLQRVAIAAENEAKRTAGWRPLRVLNVVSVSAGEGTTFARLADDSWLVGGTRPDKDTFVITAETDAADVQAFRLEVLPDDSLPQKGPGRYDNGNFHLSEFSASAMPAVGPTKGAARVELSRALADHSEAGAPIANAIDGRADTIWGVHPRYGQRHEAFFECKQPIAHQGGSVIKIRLQFDGKNGHQIGRFRLSYCTAELPPADRVPTPVEVSDLLRIPAAERTAEQRQSLALHLLGADVARELAALPTARVVYAVTNNFPPQGFFKPAPTPRPIHLFVRGDINRPGELVSPGTLGCVPDLSGDFALSDSQQEAERRAALAKGLVDDRNVLTWRSIVNRVWHYHFGRGLVDTPNDFGHVGSTPSHPELLDWLAVWFRDDAKGSFKQLHRLIVTSDTYRQTSLASEAVSATDADNRLLAHKNRRRLAAEEVRDTLLQLSGQLDLTMGGPPVVQFVDRGEATFKPPGGDPAFVDYESFEPDQPANRRRAVYRFLFRTLPDPLMDTLDCPDGGAITPVRTTSTTALQALALLNNPFVIRQCEHIAKRSSSTGPMEQQVAAAGQTILLRTPTAAEANEFKVYAERHGLANLCHVLVNSNEFLYVD